MSENKGEGISRRELLRKGAVLGGAVVWATPVVQTLSMGRAYAQTASPTGVKGISYVGIMLTGCPGDLTNFFVKWEEEGEDSDWEMYPGAVPSCADKDSLADGVDGEPLGFMIKPIANDPSCVELKIPGIYDPGLPDNEGCDEIIVWVKGGSESSTSAPCNVFTGSDLKFDVFFTVCTANA